MLHNLKRIGGIELPPHSEIIGSEFYIMDFVEGNHEVDPFLKHYNNVQREKIYDHKIDILIELASVDI